MDPFSNNRRHSKPLTKINHYLSVAPERRGTSHPTSIRGGREILEQILITKPSNVVSKIGQTGKRVPLQANYFTLLRHPDWTIYQYRIDFKPEVHLEAFRKFLIRQLKDDLIGAYLFDGTQLFTLRKLDGGDEFEKMVSGRDDGEVMVCFKFTKVVSMAESASLQILNLILRRAMGGLNLQLVGRNFFDPKATVSFFEKKKLFSINKSLVQFLGTEQNSRVQN